MINQVTLSPGVLGNLIREPSPETGSQSVDIRIDPLDGRFVRTDSVDELADALLQAQRAEQAIRGWRDELRTCLAALRTGEERTQRLRGHRRRVKIVAPPPKLDYGLLREAWDSFPRVRDELLRIERVSVKTREFRKAERTNGPADFNNCVAMVRSAIRKPTALPTVVIEH